MKTQNSRQHLTQIAGHCEEVERWWQKARRSGREDDRPLWASKEDSSKPRHPWVPGGWLPLYQHSRARGLSPQYGNLSVINRKPTGTPLYEAITRARKRLKAMISPKTVHGHGWRILGIQTSSTASFVGDADCMPGCDQAPRITNHREMRFAWCERC